MAVGEWNPILHVIMINYAVGDCTETCFSLDSIASNISVVLGLIFSHRLAKKVFLKSNYQFAITVWI